MSQFSSCHPSLNIYSLLTDRARTVIVITKIVNTRTRRRKKTRTRRRKKTRARTEIERGTVQGIGLVLASGRETRARTAIHEINGIEIHEINEIGTETRARTRIVEVMEEVEGGMVMVMIKKVDIFHSHAILLSSSHISML